MVNMYSRLRCYLYAFLLIFVSTMTHALEVTDKVKAMGGFPFPVICSDPSDLSLCVDANEGVDQACYLFEPKLDTKSGFSYAGTYGTYPNILCLWKGTNPYNGRPNSVSTTITFRTGLCPAQDQPPPVQAIFSRNGRWFPQELEDQRCFRSCLYTNGQSFDHKHYVFTNGIMTKFTERMNARLRSSQKFCEPAPEPSRNTEGEITYDANCDDSMFKVFCDFVEWYCSDTEMPDAPKVETEQLDLGLLKTDHFVIDSNAETQCFAPIEYNSFIEFSRTEVKQEISFNFLCSKIEEFGNLWRAMYLLTACFVIFGGRK